MASPSYTFSGGVSPANYTPNSITEMGGAIGKVAEQVIRVVTEEERLSIFDKTPPKNGDTIEQLIIHMASAQAYDSTGANALSRKTPTMSVKYFKDWTRAKFETTVAIPEITKVLETGEGAEDVAAKIVASLSEGEKFEKYTQTKNLLKWGRQDQSGKMLVKIGTVAYGTNGIDYEKLLVEMKNAISGMTFVNTSFNVAGINRSTRKDDIVVLMPYKLKNMLSVESLAGVFNLDKTKIDAKVIEIDVDEETIDSKKCYPVYILDKWAVLSYKRLYHMLDQKNADGDFWNYFLHTERLYGLSPLFDAGYILVKTEE